MTRAHNEMIAYLQHRLGAVLEFAAFSLFASFFIDNRFLLEQSIGRAFFFWSLALLFVPAPLVARLSRKDCVTFFAFVLLLFGGYGALALFLPTETVPRVVSILTIAVLVVLMILKRSGKKSLILDVRANVSPLLFLESLAIFGLSCIFALGFQLYSAIAGLEIPFSFTTAYFLVWVLAFSALSIAVTAIHFRTKKFRH